MLNKTNITSFFSTQKFYPILFQYVIKWLLISLIIGGLSGSASAGFLLSLDWVTNFRESNLWIILLLPIAGLLIGLSYYYFGSNIVKGNNLPIEEIHNPKKTIPLIMSPLVYIGTIVTHLFGGSAGREGTAIQMGASIADQFTRLFALDTSERKLIIICGISGGFASVFGTPLAGAIFALEIFIIGRIRYDAIFPSFMSAIIADIICKMWGVTHVHYTIDLLPEINILSILFVIAAGIIFGLIAKGFSELIHTIVDISNKKIKYPPLRPFVGGIIIVMAIWSIDSTKYIGLGIPTIVDSFHKQLPVYDFVLKILFTAVTLGMGFKGGEVTPLFFIGAVLGNTLSLFIPLPMALLAGMGLVAVFAGATNTPIACTIMGMELFGVGCGVFVGIACVTAYLFSGQSSVYQSQIIGSPKHSKFINHKGKKIHEL